MNLRGKVAIVTGAGKGIGKATAIELATEGARLVLAGIRKESIEQVKTEIEEVAKDVITVQADSSKWEDARRLAETTAEKFGRIDILINNAGVHQANQDGSHMDIQDISEADWDYIVDTNMKGQFNCAKAVMPFMIARHSGRIVMLGSTTALTGNFSSVHYIASKGGIMAMTRGLAREAGKHNVAVNCVIPGLTLTPMHDHTPKEMLERSTQFVALGRAALAEDVAKVIAFFARDDVFVTGQGLVADGGSTLH